jgi:hypothetical protein
MSLKDWERDVLNRQRNIVFPDTNLNEGRFYRNLASGKAVFSRGQKVSLLVLVLYFLAIALMALAGFVDDVFEEGSRRSQDSLIYFAYLAGTFCFWLFLGIKGLIPEPPKRKRPTGYRRSTKS